jgi:hypothetical protein
MRGMVRSDYILVFAAIRRLPQPVSESIEASERCSMGMMLVYNNHP